MRRINKEANLSVQLRVAAHAQPGERAKNEHNDWQKG